MCHSKIEALVKGGSVKKTEENAAPAPKKTAGEKTAEVWPSTVGTVQSTVREYEADFVQTARRNGQSGGAAEAAFWQMF